MYINSHKKMKPKVIIASILYMICTLVAPAQEVHQVKSVEPRLEDVYNVLNDLGIYVFRFDLSSFLDDVYEVEGYVAEYKKNRPTENVHTFQLGNNIGFLDDIPEEHQQEIRDAYQIPKGENHWDKIKDLTICIRHTDKKDSTANIKFSSTGLGTMSRSFKLQPITRWGIYQYESRPFLLLAEEKEEYREIPLILYGSWWEEPGTTIYRFCGERKIDPELQSEILKHIPHYYLIGIRMKKKNSK